MFYMDKYGNERMRKTVPYKKRPYTSTYKKKKVKKNKKNKKKWTSQHLKSPLSERDLGFLDKKNKIIQ